MRKKDHHQKQGSHRATSGGDDAKWTASASEPSSAKASISREDAFEFTPDRIADKRLAR